MSMTVEEIYRQETHNALEKCQFIEETLRMCIFSALKIAQVQLSPYFPINYKTKDISKLPLGALVRLFSKINDDSTLLSSLKEITPDRNKVAHSSLLFTLGELGDEKHMEEATAEMRDILARATDVHNSLLDVRYELIKSLHRAKRSTP